MAGVYITNTEGTEKTVLDEIRDLVPQAGTHNSICIKKDSDSPPIIVYVSPIRHEFESKQRKSFTYSPSASRIDVGGKWLTDEQWAKLIVMRMNSDIKLNESDGIITIEEKPLWTWSNNTVAIGYSAGMNNTTGYHNVAIGYDCVTSLGGNSGA